MVGRELQRGHEPKCYRAHPRRRRASAEHGGPTPLATIARMVSLARAAGLARATGLPVAASGCWRACSPSSADRRSIDIIRDHEVLLTWVLVGPLVAAIGASTIEVADRRRLLGRARAARSGQVNDIFFTSDHVIRVARRRGRVARGRGADRDPPDAASAELEIARPQARRRATPAARARRGRDGDLALGPPDGNRRLGRASRGAVRPRAGTFDGSIETYRSLFHPDDRGRGRSRP